MLAEQKVTSEVTQSLHVITPDCQPSFYTRVIDSKHFFKKLRKFLDFTMILMTLGPITNIPTARSAEAKDTRNLTCGLLRSFFVFKMMTRVIKLPVIVVRISNHITITATTVPASMMVQVLP